MHSKRARYFLKLRKNGSTEKGTPLRPFSFTHRNPPASVPNQQELLHHRMPSAKMQIKATVDVNKNLLQHIHWRILYIGI